MEGEFTLLASSICTCTCISAYTVLGCLNSAPPRGRRGQRHPLYDIIYMSVRIHIQAKATASCSKQKLGNCHPPTAPLPPRGIIKGCQNELEYGGRFCTNPYDVQGLERFPVRKALRFWGALPTRCVFSAAVYNAG